MATENLLSKFAEHLTELGLSSTTIVNYLADMRVFIRWFSQAKGISASILDLSPADVQDYLLYLQAAQGRAPSTINRHLQSIRSFCNFAVGIGLMESNPCAGVKPLKGSKRLTLRVLDRAEIAHLMEAVQQRRPRLVKRDYAIIQVLLQTGIRVSELCNLRLSDLELSEEGGALTIRTARGQKCRRIPLNASVRKAISAYLDVRPPRAESDHLFLTQAGTPLSIRAVQQLVSDYAKAAGLERVSANTLRHTFAKCMLEDTGDLALVSKLLGYVRIETAAKYIAPREEEDVTEVMEKSSLNVYWGNAGSLVAAP